MALSEGRVMNVDQKSKTHQWLQCGQDPGSSSTDFEVPRQLPTPSKKFRKQGHARPILLGVTAKADVSEMSRGGPRKGSSVWKVI